MPGHPVNKTIIPAVLSYVLLTMRNMVMVEVMELAVIGIRGWEM